MKVSYRSIFIAPPGKLLVSVDLSQAESWVVAYLANERNMKYALFNSDIHCQSAGAIYVLNGCNHDWIKKENKCRVCGTVLTKDQRYIGKRKNHSTAYGVGPDKSARIINADSDKPPYVSVTVKESETHHNLWHSYYNVKGWWGRVLEKGREMITSYGRKRTFYGQWGDELEREKIAFEPQSTVADHFNGKIHPEVGIEGGLIKIYETLIKPWWCGATYCDHQRCHKIINQAHDSCILEIPKDSALNIGEEAMRYLYRPIIINDETFTIPVDGKIGERWDEDEMEEIKI